MEINVSNKTVEIWLTKEEKTCDKTKQELKNLIEMYANQNLFVAVFTSGNENLTSCTSSLICNNI